VEQTLRQDATSDSNSSNNMSGVRPGRPIIDRVPETLAQHFEQHAQGDPEISTTNITTLQCC
jgi:hypothetical protein